MQTEDYARALFSQLEPHMSREGLAKATEARMRRQRILWQAGRSFEFLLFENALYSVYSSLHDHLAQLDRICQLSMRRNIGVAIIPSTRTLPIETAY